MTDAPELEIVKSKRCTTDGQPPRTGYERREAPAPVNPETGQHEAYWILCDEERAQGFVRPVRRSYIHSACGSVTTMGQKLAETYARDPSFYGATFCCGCRGHFPVSEFKWHGTDERLGS